jgi:hypothetical protein
MTGTLVLMAETSGGASAPDDRPVPASRYGRKPRSPVSQRWMAIVLTALVVALGLAVARLGYQRFEGNAVEGETAAFEVLDDQTVSITISVTRKDPATPVVCIVRARSRDGAETGRREILVGASQAKTVQVTTTVKSYKRPFVGDIYGCGVDVPGYLRGAS